MLVFFFLFLNSAPRKPSRKIAYTLSEAVPGRAAAKPRRKGGDGRPTGGRVWCHGRPEMCHQGYDRKGGKTMEDLQGQGKEFVLDLRADGKIILGSCITCSKREER